MHKAHNSLGCQPAAVLPFFRSSCCLMQLTMTLQGLGKKEREREKLAGSSQRKFPLHLHAVLKPEICWNKICQADLKPFFLLLKM